MIYGARPRAARATHRNLVLGGGGKHILNIYISF